MDLFRSDVPEGILADNEADLWLQEIALDIMKAGCDGMRFLLESMHGADDSRLRAVLGSLACSSDYLDEESRGKVKSILVSFLTHSNPALIMESTDSLRMLGFSEVADKVFPLLGHKSPYVVGGALRYLNRHRRDAATPLLIRALESPEPIIRQNAIDELEELGLPEMLPRLYPLLDDPDKYVREAALSAIRTLEGEDSVDPGMAIMIVMT
jgi:hypothetical protein